jgi:eukaryotic-like serine/threonine-protein kinase
LTEAVFGNREKATDLVKHGLGLGQGSFIPLESARALVFCNAKDKAEPLLAETAKRFPLNTILQERDLPTLRAALDLERDPARSVDALKSAATYELATTLGDSGVYMTIYVRGLAQLRLHAGAAAAAEFQKIVDKPGLAPLSPLRPLAQLGLARAFVESGDSAKARRAYQDLLALWKDADPDLPALQQAKKEYAGLK